MFPAEIALVILQLVPLGYQLRAHELRKAISARAPPLHAWADIGNLTILEEISDFSTCKATLSIRKNTARCF